MLQFLVTKICYFLKLVQDLHVFSYSEFDSTALFLWAFKTFCIVQSIFASYGKLLGCLFLIL